MNDVTEPVVTRDLSAVARTVTYRPDERLGEFGSLSLAEKSAVFHLLSSNVQQSILASLSFMDALELLDHMDPVSVHQTLAKMRNEKRRARLIARLKSDRYEKCEFFLQFHPQASFSLFYLNYLYLSESMTVGEAAELIEKHLHATGKVPVVLTHKDGVLSGEVPLSSMVKERKTSKLRSLARPVRSIAYNAVSVEVLPFFTAAPHEKVVILDQDGSVLGLVYSDDVIDLLDEVPAVTLYSFAGVEASERPFDGVMDKVKGRYRWLLINLGTCFLVGGVVALFDRAISEFVALAIFMPMIAGMGGNASTQTLAVMVRGIAVGEVNLKNCYHAITREVLSGLVNGLITGLVLLPVALLFGVDWRITVIAAIAVVFNLVVAGFSGALIPLVLKHFGKDPATSAGIFISTATDILGLMFFLGVATVFLL